MKIFDRFLIILLCVSFVKGMVWTVLFPAFQGPDESSYFSYVQYIAENRRFPRTSFEQEGYGVSEQLEHVFKFVELAPLKFHPLNHQNFSENIFFDFSNFDAKPRQDYLSYGYSPLYALLNVPLYFLFPSNPVAQIFSMRLLSSLLSLGIVLFAYLGGKLLFSDQKYAFLFALLVAFHPMLSHISSLVHIDVLLNLASAGFFYYVIKFLTQSSHSRKDWLLFFFWFLLAIFSKIHGYLLFPILLIFFIFKFRSQIFSSKKILSLFSLSFLITVFLAKKYFWVHIIKIASSTQELLALLSPLEFFKKIIVTGFVRPLYFSFFAHFGWLDTMVEKPYYLIIAIMVFLSVLGIFLSFLKMFKRKSVTSADRCSLFSIISLALVTFVYFVTSLTQYSAQKGLLEFSQGRYYFFLIIPITVLFFHGIFSLFPKRFHDAVSFCLAFLVIFFHFVSVIQYILPRYYG